MTYTVEYVAEGVKPWGHRKTAPVKYAYLPATLSLAKRGAFIFYRTDGRLVTELCLGERYAHVASGLIFSDEQYRGCYIDNWHGGPSGSLSELVRWIAEAEHPEWQWDAWMIDGE